MRILIVVRHNKTR